MYVEERMYTLQVGTAAQYFKNYEEFGMKVQLRHLPHMVGYYVTESGPLNLVIHLWAYDDLNQRDKCRAAMQADPGLAGLPREEPAVHDLAGHAHHEMRAVLRRAAEEDARRDK
jgi:hypothetical protein